MKIYKVLFICILCLISSSCIFSPVNVDNIYCSLQKKSYKINEDIDVKISCEFSPQEYVEGIALYIFLQKDGEEGRFPFEITEITNSNIKQQIENDFFQNEYIYFISQKNNSDVITSFNEHIRIQVSESGEYNLSLFFIVSGSKQLHGISKDIKIPFNVIE